MYMSILETEGILQKVFANKMFNDQLNLASGKHFKMY